MIRTLLARGADPLQDLGDDRTPLHLAVVEETFVLDTLFLLISSGRIVERIVTKSRIRIG